MSQYYIRILLSIFSILSVLQIYSQETTEDNTVSTEIKLIDKFTSYLKGEYSSQAQNARDTSYLNIHLVMYPIWEEDKEGKWFYVEQAVVGNEEKPYRQRVYRITETSPTTIVSAIYSLKNQDDFIQLHLSKKKTKAFSKDELSYKEGCDVFLELKGDYFEGGTNGKDCESKLRGAKYATTEVQLYSNKLVSWDRGFTINGIHAWGATKGGYIFDKISE